MLETHICEKARNGNCKIDCYHGTYHQFAEGYCNIDLECQEKEKHVRCIRISGEYMCD